MNSMHIFLQKLRAFFKQKTVMCYSYLVLSLCICAGMFLLGMFCATNRFPSSNTLISQDVMDKTIATTEKDKTPIITVSDNDRLAKHSPEHYYASFDAIDALEDMDKYVVVYYKPETQGIRQVVVKDKNSGEIFCYECKKTQNGGFEITHSYIRKNPQDSTDKLKGM